jgi:peptidoglycan hydrolase-like protein with peptidoglycan-binding domain
MIHIDSMKYSSILKIIVSAFSIIILIAGASSSMADTSNPSGASGCVSLSQYLLWGSVDATTNNEVGALQDYLVSSGLLDSVSVGIGHGIFGHYTEAAVKLFQQNNGIAPTGTVGPITRAKIAALTCGSASAQSSSSAATGSTTPASAESVVSTSTPVSPAQSSNAQSIQLLSPNGGESIAIGKAYTITWTSSNIGNTPVSLYLETKGQSGDVEVYKPIATDLQGAQYVWNVDNSITPDTYLIKIVTDPTGATPPVEDESDAVFSIIPAVTQVETSGGGGGGSSTGPSAGTPAILALNPSSGPVGTVVTVSGSGFSPSDTVNFSWGVINTTSSDGATLTFTVPSSIAPQCDPTQGCPAIIQDVSPGSYQVSVTAASGVSNTVSFNVTDDSGESAVIEAVHGFFDSLGKWLFSSH